MVFLYVFGPNVEDRLGRWGFAAFYLLGGAAAGLAHLAESASPVIGASGAISAVTGAYLALFPRTKLRVLVFFFYIGIFWIPAWWLIALAIAKDLVFQGFSGGDNVARMAHLGGYAFGLSVCISLLWWKILPREPFDLFSIGKQAKRRRDFKELASKGTTPWKHEVSGGAGGSRVKKKPSVNEALAEAALEERAQIASLLAEGKLDEAATRYEKASGHYPDFSLARADLIAMGNHLFSQERHQLAASAYESLISRFHSDTEVPRAMLMLALINARYLNDPTRAKELIEAVRGRNLDSTYKPLLDTLADELG